MKPPKIKKVSKTPKDWHRLRKIRVKAKAPKIVVGWD